MTEQQRDFKGVWIAKEIWLDTRLNALEKVILAEVDSLDVEKGCFASNQYLAEFCQCSITKVSTAISKLITLGYIRTESFDGRTRILKTCLSDFERQTFKICKADVQNLKDNNTNNNTSNKEIPSITPKGGEAAKNGVQALFNEFWDAYPRKVDKKGAERAFLRIKGIFELFPQIMDALDACKRSDQWQKDGGQFIPHPTTWLRQERWTATIEAPQRQKSSFDADEFFKVALAKTYGEERKDGQGHD